MAEAVTSSAQHRLRALTLQLAPAERSRRPLLKASDACFESVVLEDHAFERIEAAIEIVHARPGAFEQRVPPTG
jgi:hypothetical protein